MKKLLIVVMFFISMFPIFSFDLDEVMEFKKATRKFEETFYNDDLVVNAAYPIHLFNLKALTSKDLKTFFPDEYKYFNNLYSKYDVSSILIIYIPNIEEISDYRSDALISIVVFESDNACSEYRWDTVGEIYPEDIFDSGGYYIIDSTYYDVLGDYEYMISPYGTPYKMTTEYTPFGRDQRHDFVINAYCNYITPALLKYIDIVVENVRITKPRPIVIT